MTEPINPVCSVCDQPAEVRRLCRKHYQRLRKNGHTDAIPRPTPTERFRAKVRVTEAGCWYWTASKNRLGYGYFSEDRRVWLAHRWAYARFVGPLVEGMTIDHLCRNTSCVNPAHLEQVTSAENMARTKGYRFSAYARGDRTHCKRGHLMDERNAYRRPDRVNSYACRACMREHHKNYVERKGGAA